MDRNQGGKRAEEGVYHKGKTKTYKTGSNGGERSAVKRLGGRLEDRLKLEKWRGAAGVPGSQKITESTKGKTPSSKKGKMT